MKKINLITFALLILLSLNACTNQISVGGENYEEELVTSGYYLDKASISEAAFVEALSNVKEIKKPSSLGTVELVDVSTIEISEEPATEVTDADVEAEIERERDADTTYTPVTVKRKAEMGDKVIIDFKGSVDGKEFDGGAAEDYELTLGSGQFIPGFEDQVAGHMAGSSFSINVTFPEDYTETLAGKKAKFDITIKSIEEPVKPEIDNLFVVNHTKKNSYNPEEYKDEVRERLTTQNEFMRNESAIYQLSSELLTKSKFEPTEEALAWQFSLILSQYNESAKQSGSNLATMLASSGQSVREVYDQIKLAVPEAVKSEMLMDELRKSYKITLTDDEVKEWFQNVADIYGYGSQFNFDEYVETVGMENLKKSVEGEKILLEVLKKCKRVVKEEE